jgi:hypothetical protein
MAIGNWSQSFDHFVEYANTLSPTIAEKDDTKPPKGIFSVISHSLPLPGPINKVKGSCAASVVRITHIFGVSKFVEYLLAGNGVDEDAKVTLDPNGSAAQDQAATTNKLLDTYNNIRNNFRVK